jgi:hypothetical protein
MILCPSCSQRNPEDAKTCQACGESMAAFVYRVCPSCDATNAAESAFCHRCLSPLDGSVALDAEPGDDVPVTPYTPPTAMPPSVARPRPKAAPPPPDTAGKGMAPILTTPVQPPPSPPTSLVTADTAAMPDPLTLVRDPLTGLEQLLPGDERVLAAQRAPIKPVQHEPDRSQEEADLFHRVATEPVRLGTMGRVVEPADVPPLPRWGRMALYLLVLLAALAPWFSGNRAASLVTPRPSVVALADDLAAVPQGGAALVAFDYGPGAAGELDPLAMATLQGLAARGVRIVALSSDPAGVGQAQHVLAALAAALPGYEYGRDYVVLGYAPGQDAGLRAVGESLTSTFPADYVQTAALSTLPAMDGIQTVGDVDRVIVLTDDGQTLRRWVEQVQGRTGVRIDALVTAAVEPLLAPYRQSGQLGHVLSGATGAIEYRRALGAPGGAVDRTDGYAALVAVLVGVALVTNGAEAVAWGRRRRARRAAVRPERNR